MESVCRGNSTVGSNPTLSARISGVLRQIGALESHGNPRIAPHQSCAVGAQRRGVDGDEPSAMIPYVIDDITPCLLACGW